MILGLVASVVLAHGSLLRAIGMIIVGLLFGLVGTDVNTGVPRYTFDMLQLADGINFVVVAMGMFGLGEIICNLEHEETRSMLSNKVGRLMPDKDNLKRIVAPILLGTSLGSALGILPGGGAMLASFAAYSVEKKISKNAAHFGKGAIEGVAAPEAANNAGAQTSFIPMLTLGIPSNPVMASMWVGNLFLIVLNLPMIGLWVRTIMVPYHFLFPGILVFCAIGVFSLSNTEFDVYMMALFGLFGYICSKLEMEAAPMLLGFIIGPMMEEYLRRALLLSHSDPLVFLQRPISATMLAVSVTAMVFVVSPSLRRKREETFAE